MHSKFFLLFCGIASSLLLSACNRYSVSVNDNVVYTPPSLLSGYKLEDAVLQACVEQTIIDAQITSKENFTRLNCSNAGIRSLAGLSSFFELRELNLADNQLTDITEIGRLGRLEKLMLNNNNISNAEPLLHLLHLTELNLAQNDSLKCKELNQLISNYAGQEFLIELPNQCTR